MVLNAKQQVSTALSMSQNVHQRWVCLSGCSGHGYHRLIPLPENSKLPHVTNSQ